MEAWATGLISGLAGVFMGGVLTSFNGWIQFRRDRDTKQQEFIRSRIEEAYKLVDELDNILTEVRRAHDSKSYAETVFFDSPKNWEEQWNEIGRFASSEDIDKIKKVRAQLRMVIELYLPGLRSNLLKFNDCFGRWVSVTRLERTFWSSISADSPRRLSDEELAEINNFREILDTESENFIWICEELKHSLSVLSRRTIGRRVLRSFVLGKDALEVPIKIADGYSKKPHNLL